MSQGLTNEITLKEVQKLVDMCFQSNAILDNIVYQMAIPPLNVPKLYNFTHQVLSHSLPITFADAITDFMIERNDRLYRGALEGANKIYNNIIECYEDIVKVFSNINNQIVICIDSAIDTNDKPVEDFLRGFLVDKGTLYLKQAQTLLDGAKQYEEAGILPLFNGNFEDFVILSS